MLKKSIDSLFKQTKKIRLNKKDMPKHVAVTINGNLIWSRKHGVEIGQVYKKGFKILEEIMAMQVRLNIPVLTVSLLTEEMKSSERFPIFLDKIVEFLEKLKQKKIIHKNQMRVSVLGKWYDLPGRIVDQIKSLIDETKDYDKYFVNFCINYNGQEEIVDAAKLISRKIMLGKMDIESISKATIKEETYSSYFVPPDLIIKTGKKRRIGGLLLWDSPYSKIYFSDKLWPDFNKLEFMKAMGYYVRN